MKVVSLVSKRRYGLITAPLGMPLACQGIGGVLLDNLVQKMERPKRHTPIQVSEEDDIRPLASVVIGNVAVHDGLDRWNVI